MIPGGTAVGSTRLAADGFPGRPSILRAADQINSLAPQGIPKQTITVGLYDATAREFSWALDEVCVPDTPAHTCVDQGGTVQPRHVARINSYNVTYKFVIKNAPAGFTARLSTPDGRGGATEVTGKADANGNALLSFHPQSVQEQVARLGSTVLRITPALQPQLGAFVVPYVLISIVYEPPGADSSATYENTSTVGSTVTWGFERTWGLSNTANPDEVIDFLKNGAAGNAGSQAGEGVGGVVGAATDSVGGAIAGGIASAVAKAAVDAYVELGEQNVVTITTDTTTHGVSRSIGSTISLTEGFFTAAHRYPGQGDVFVILRDVLFVYVVNGGRVFLTPVAFSDPSPPLTAAELKTELPPRVAASFLALDPLVAGVPIKTSGGSPGRGTPAPRFIYLESLQCRNPVGQYVRLSQDQIETSGVSQTTSETVVQKHTGLVNSFIKTPDDVAGYSLSTSATQLTGNGTAAQITLHCSESEGEYQVDVYYDTLFRTFIGVKAEPLASRPQVSGTVKHVSGAPARRHEVKLKAGKRRYVVSADDRGRFDFRFATIPKGAATLLVGKKSVRLKIGKAPVRGVAVTLEDGER